MNLLLLDQFSEPGGAQQVLLELLPAIREAGWHGVVGLPGHGPLFESVRSCGFAPESITCGPYASGKKSLGDAARFLAGTPKLAGEIRSLASRTRAQVIYINGPRLVPAVALARPRIPSLFHVHSYIGPGPARRMIGAALRRSGAHVVGSCEFVANPWRAYVDRERLSVIYNGVAGPNGAPVVKPAGCAPVIGCIGRIAPEKGQMEFLEAARAMHSVLPKARFRICGAPLFDDPAALKYDAEVRTAARGLPVEFSGWIPDVYEALAGLDLLLVPSAGHEATTRVILEAFAAGVPVIAFRAGGIPEVVDDGLDGFLADDAAEMAKRAIEFLTGPTERRRSVSEAARQTWSRRFTRERQQHQLLETIAQAACR